MTDSDRSPLHWAASEGDSVKVLQLLEKKVDVDAVDDVSRSNCGGGTD